MVKKSERFLTLFPEEQPNRLLVSSFKKPFGEFDKNDPSKLSSDGTISIQGPMSPISPRKKISESSKVLEVDEDGKALEEPFEDESGKLILTTSRRKLSQFLGANCLKEKNYPFSSASKLQFHYKLEDLSKVHDDFQNNEDLCLGKESDNSNARFSKNPEGRVLEDCTSEQELSYYRNPLSDANRSCFSLEKETAERGQSSLSVHESFPISPQFEVCTIERCSKKLNGYCINILTKLNFLETSKKLSKDLFKDDHIEKTEIIVSSNPSKVNVDDDQQKETSNVQIRENLLKKQKRVRNFLKEGESFKNFDHHTPSNNLSVVLSAEKKAENSYNLTVLKTKFNEVIRAVEGKDQVTKSKLSTTPNPRHFTENKPLCLPNLKMSPYQSCSEATKIKNFKFSRENITSIGSANDLSKVESNNLRQKFSFETKKSSHAIFYDGTKIPFEQSKINCALLSEGLEDLRMSKSSTKKNQDHHFKISDPHFNSTNNLKQVYKTGFQKSPILSSMKRVEKNFNTPESSQIAKKTSLEIGLSRFRVPQLIKANSDQKRDHSKNSNQKVESNIRFQIPEKHHPTQSLVSMNPLKPKNLRDGKSKEIASIQNNKRSSRVKRMTKLNLSTDKTISRANSRSIQRLVSFSKTAENFSIEKLSLKKSSRIDPIQGS